MTVLDDLYKSNVSVQLEMYADFGIIVRLGDRINGFTAETQVWSWAEVERWLTLQACYHHPRSEFARKYRSTVAPGFLKIGASASAPSSRGRPSEDS
jgi:hypothetical protein